MKPKIIVKAGVPKGYMEPEEADSWIDYKKAKAAAIAEAKEFENAGRIKELILRHLHIVEAVININSDGTLKDGTYDSPVGWVEVRQYYNPAGKWMDRVSTEQPEKKEFEYRTILRLKEHE